MVSSEQTTFVKDRQILDDPLIVNEVVEGYKKNHKKMMILKIDFTKAYDLVNWEYLDRVMKFMNFGLKWRG